MQKRSIQRISRLAAAVALLLAGPASADPPQGYAPLSAEERASAAAVGRSRADAVRAARKRPGAPGAPAARPGAASEVILVERLEQGKTAGGAAAPRRADVYVYDYATDRLRRTIVDPATGTVHGEEVVQGVQLPLTGSEVQRALDIAYADAATRAQLEARYRAVAGEVLTDIDQLQVKAFVFHADSKPEGLNAASQRCGVHRCAQLLLYTSEQVVIEIQPIVDLSEGVVTQQLEF